MASLVKKIISTAKAPAALGPYRYACEREGGLSEEARVGERVLPLGLEAAPGRGSARQTGAPKGLWGQRQTIARLPGVLVVLGEVVGCFSKSKFGEIIVELVISSEWENKQTNANKQKNQPNKNMQEKE